MCLLWLLILQISRLSILYVLNLRNTLIGFRMKKTLPVLSFINSETLGLPETTLMSSDSNIVFSSASVMYLFTCTDESCLEVNVCVRRP